MRREISVAQLMIGLLPVAFGQPYRESPSPVTKHTPGVRFEVQEYVLQAGIPLPERFLPSKGQRRGRVIWPVDGQAYSWKGMLWSEYLQFSGDPTGEGPVSIWSNPKTRFNLDTRGESRRVTEYDNTSRGIEPSLVRVLFPLVLGTEIKVQLGSFRHKEFGEIIVSGIGNPSAEGKFEQVEWIAKERSDLQIWRGDRIQPGTAKPYREFPRVSGIMVDEIAKIGSGWLPTRISEYGVDRRKLSRVSLITYALDPKVNASLFVPPRVEGDIWEKNGWNYVVRGGELSFITYQPNHPFIFWGLFAVAPLSLIYLAYQAHKLFGKSNGSIFGDNEGTGSAGKDV